MPKYIDVDSAAYDYGTLADWLIYSVGPEPPVWTEPHIEELIEDFYVVPKSTPPADVVEVRHGQKIEITTVEDWCPWCKCSVCGYDGLFLEDDYCSHCGAKLDGKMDGGKDE